MGPPAVRCRPTGDTRPEGPGLRVRLPPQSPSRYILSPAAHSSIRRPVAPAVSESLHSRHDCAIMSSKSGCPRSLQVATFRSTAPACMPRCPVAPAVSKSLHSFFKQWGGVNKVRLPPQSPSRYIPPPRVRRVRCGPVAPAVSKSLHSVISTSHHSPPSGCPCSLQVATFRHLDLPPQSPVRLPPQSPSRYIPQLSPVRTRPSPVAPAVSKSLHSSRTELSVRLEPFRLRQRIDPLVQGHSS